jgi:hypothetical protein
MVAVVVAAATGLTPGLASAGDPPETTITSGPEGLSNDTAPGFGFDSDQPGSSFACRLDGGTWTPREGLAVAVPMHVFNPGWEPCASPWSYRSVEDGSHTFEVRATNPAGDPDPTPASRTFAVETGVAATLISKSTQRQPRKNVRVKLEVRAQEQLAVRAGGTVALERPRPRARARYGLEPRTAQLAGNQAATLSLRLEQRSEARKTAGALRQGYRADARLTVTLTNVALGNSVARRLTVKLRAG